MNLNMNAATRVGLSCLFLLVGVAALWFGRTILVPTIISLLLAAMLWPATMWLHQKLRFGWNAACLTVVIGLVLLNLLITAGFILAIPQLLQPLPRSDDEVLLMYNKFRDRLEQISPVEFPEDILPREATELKQIRAFHYITEAVQQSLPQVLINFGLSLTSYVWQWILIMFILLFLLLEGRMLIRRVVEIFGPSPEVQTKARRVLSDMAHQVRTYLVWRTLINIGVAIFLGLVYRWAGLAQSWTWAILSAVLFYIPYLGPIVAGIPPVIDAFVSSDHPAVALGILLFYLVVTVIEGYIIVPVVMGRSMELNATTVMLACLFWELVWGVVGLFLAMPIMAAIRAICFHVPGWQPWANLMSISEEEPKPIGLDPSRPDLILGDGRAVTVGDKVPAGVAGEGSQVKSL
jgi:predicted PurR-regulated permease PerM